jgi:hypothetical protein
MSVNEASRIVIDDSRVSLKIVVSLTDSSRGIIYDHMFIAQAAVQDWTFNLKLGRFAP